MQAAAYSGRGCGGTGHIADRTKGIMSSVGHAQAYLGSDPGIESDPPAHELMVSRQETGALHVQKKRVAISEGTTSSEDCFVCLTDLDCGKSLAPLAFVTQLREDTRRTLMVQHDRCGGPMNAGCATKLT